MRLARIRGDIPSTLPHKTHRPEAQVSDSFISSKRDKRIIKHSTFISKIKKSSSASAAKKRRRPNKKLVATLESLSDALPTLDAEKDGDASQLREGKVRHRSIRCKPGALKRKETIVKGEMERFRVSLARLSAIPEKPPAVSNTDIATGQSTGQKQAQGNGRAREDEGAVTQHTTAPSSTTNRWAALRGFISATMEQNPAFIPNDGKKP
jgi:hypothetical protein